MGIHPAPNIKSRSAPKCQRTVFKYRQNTERLNTCSKDVCFIAGVPLRANETGYVTLQVTSDVEAFTDIYCRRTDQSTWPLLRPIGCHGNAASTTARWSCSRRELYHHSDETTCLTSPAGQRSRQLVKATTAGKLDAALKKNHKNLQHEECIGLQQVNSFKIHRL